MNIVVEVSVDDSMVLQHSSEYGSQLVQVDEATASAVLETLAKATQFVERQRLEWKEGRKT
jgi:hypothetical protein